MPVGEAAVLAELPEDQVLGLLDDLRADLPPGVTDLVPAERTLLVAFDPSLLTAETVAARLRAADPRTPHQQDGAPPVVLHVTYDGADLGDVADLLGTDADGLVRAHTEVEWRVAFSGFAPGFAYLRPPDGRLSVPRRSSPRTRVPAGSVALAAGYTGVYPGPSPGGWHLIGRTGAELWNPARAEPALLTPGTRVRFRPLP